MWPGGMRNGRQLRMSCCWVLPALLLPLCAPCCLRCGSLHTVRDTLGSWCSQTSAKLWLGSSSGMRGCSWRLNHVVLRPGIWWDSWCAQAKLPHAGVAA